MVLMGPAVDSCFVTEIDTACMFSEWIQGPDLI
jgi:hypothetical protein